MTTVKFDGQGTKTEMIWWIGDTEAHYGALGALTHVYSHISLGTPIGRVDRTGNTATNIEYQFHGLANSLLAAVDRTGGVNSSFSYAPFGEIIEATDGGGSTGAGVTAHRRRMNDMFVDEVSDLSYYGVRYYDKTSLLWTQADPLYRFAPERARQYPRKANLYQFSLNNPLRYIDPDGRDSGDTTDGGSISSSVTVESGSFWDLSDIKSDLDKDKSTPQLTVDSGDWGLPPPMSWLANPGDCTDTSIFPWRVVVWAGFQMVASIGGGEADAMPTVFEDEAVATDSVATAAPRLTGDASADTDPLLINGFAVPTEEGGFFNVVTHSDSKTPFVWRNGRQVRTSHQDLVDLVKNNPAYKGQRVRLIACHAGECANGLAQRVANGLGADVEAADDFVWINEYGHYWTKGEWWRFKPVR